MIYSPKDVLQILDEVLRTVSSKSFHSDPYKESAPLVALKDVELVISKIKETL